MPNRVLYVVEGRDGRPEMAHADRAALKAPIAARIRFGEDINPEPVVYSPRAVCRDEALEEAAIACEQHSGEVGRFVAEKGRVGDFFAMLIRKMKEEQAGPGPRADVIEEAVGRLQPLAEAHDHVASQLNGRDHDVAMAARDAVVQCIRALEAMKGDAG